MTSSYLGKFNASKSKVFVSFINRDATGLINNLVGGVGATIYFIVNNTTGALFYTGGNLSSNAITGFYYKIIDVLDYDGIGTDLPVGSYTVLLGSMTEAGFDTGATYQFELVALGATPEEVNAQINSIDTATQTSNLTSTVEDAVWDADPANHITVNTFGKRTFTETNITNILNALSVPTTYTAGNDVATLKTKSDLLEAVAVGRWKVDAIAKTLTFYKLDTNILKVFDLKDPEGDPTTVNVAERVPQ